MPFQNEHSCRIRPPEAFQQDSFRRSKDVGAKGRDFIYGRLKGQTTMTLQTIRYDKTLWSEERAKDDCKQHNGSFEAAKKTQ